MTRLTESEAEDAVLEWRDGIRWRVACGPDTASIVEQAVLDWFRALGYDAPRFRHEDRRASDPQRAMWGLPAQAPSAAITSSVRVTMATFWSA